MIISIHHIDFYYISFKTELLNIKLSHKQQLQQQAVSNNLTTLDSECRLTELVSDTSGTIRDCEWACVRTVGSTIFTMTTSSGWPTPELGSSERPITGEFGTDFLLNGLRNMSTKLEDDVSCCWGNEHRFGKVMSPACNSNTLITYKHTHTYTGNYKHSKSELLNSASFY